MATLDEDTVFTFTWKIENISLYAGDIDAELSSPSFTVGTTKRAEFQVYLTSGYWTNKSICLRTLRLPRDLDTFIKYELSLLRDDGEVIEIGSRKYGHLRQWEWVFFLYKQPAALFSDARVLKQFLPQNTLIIRWKVYRMGSGECFFRTVFHNEGCNCKIQEFSKRQTFTQIIHLSSQNITIELTKWYYNIIIAKFITSNQDRLHSGNCSIIAVDEEKNAVCWDGKVDVMCYKKTPPIFFYDGPEVNEPTGHHWEAPVLLHEEVCNLIKNDTLSLKFKFTVGIGEVWNVKSNALVPQVSPITLRSDLLHLYENRKFCDATLKTGTSSFPVHKTVLCARSPVFCAMFESDTEEGRTGIVHIPDIEPDILETMLRFLYSDILGDDIAWEVAAGLYYAADKYHIQALKDKSVSVMIEKLSVANTCEALVLADTHQDKDLMQAVKDFVAYHDEVIKSVQWKELEKKNPSLTIQFFREMYFKKKKYH